MKTILDLLREFVNLNETKIGQDGKLPPDSEKRWAELKRIYDVLMGDNGISRRRVTRRFGAAAIREGIPRRKNLRVPVSMEIVLERKGQYHSGRVLNLSCGGVFLSSDRVFDIGSQVTLYLANIGRGADAVMAVEGVVAWNRKATVSGFPRGMGIRFVDLEDRVQNRLDAFVLETLEKHLDTIGPDVLDPEIIRRENIQL